MPPPTDTTVTTTPKPLDFYVFEFAKDSRVAAGSTQTPNSQPTKSIFTEGKPVIIYLPGDGFGNDGDTHAHSVKTLAERLRREGYQGEVRIVSLKYPDSNAEEAEFKTQIKERLTDPKGFEYSRLGKQVSLELVSDIPDVTKLSGEARKAEIAKFAAKMKNVQFVGYSYGAQIIEDMQNIIPAELETRGFTKAEINEQMMSQIKGVTFGGDAMGKRATGDLSRPSKIVHVVNEHDTTAAKARSPDLTYKPGEYPVGKGNERLVVTSVPTGAYREETFEFMKHNTVVVGKDDAERTPSPTGKPIDITLNDHLELINWSLKNAQEKIVNPKVVSTLDSPTLIAALEGKTIQPAALVNLSSDAQRTFFENLARNKLLPPELIQKIWELPVTGPNKEASPAQRALEAELKRFIEQDIRTPGKNGKASITLYLMGADHQQKELVALREREAILTKELELKPGDKSIAGRLKGVQGDLTRVAENIKILEEAAKVDAQNAEKAREIEPKRQTLELEKKQLEARVEKVKEEYRTAESDAKKNLIKESKELKTKLAEIETKILDLPKPIPTSEAVARQAIEQLFDNKLVKLVFDGTKPSQEMFVRMQDSGAITGPLKKGAVVPDKVHGKPVAAGAHDIQAYLGPKEGQLSNIPNPTDTSIPGKVMADLAGGKPLPTRLLEAPEVAPPKPAVDKDMVARLELVEEVKKGQVWRMRDPKTGREYFAKTASPSEVTMTQKAAQFTPPKDSPVAIVAVAAAGNDNIPPSLKDKITPRPERNSFLITEAMPAAPTLSQMVADDPAQLAAAKKALRDKPITASEMKLIIEIFKTMNEGGVYNHDASANTTVRRLENGQLQVSVFDFEPDNFKKVYKGHEDVSLLLDEVKIMVKNGMAEPDALKVVQEYAAPERIAPDTAKLPAKEALNVQKGNIPVVPPVAAQPPVVAPKPFDPEAAFDAARRQMSEAGKGMLASDYSTYLDAQKMLGRLAQPVRDNLKAQPKFKRVADTEKMLEVLKGVNLDDPMAVAKAVQGVMPDALSPEGKSRATGIKPTVEFVFEPQKPKPVEAPVVKVPAQEFPKIKPAASKDGVKYYTPEQAAEVFKALKSDRGIPFASTDGCHVRRETMLINMVGKMDVQPSSVGRIMVMAENLPGATNINTLVVQNQFQYDLQALGERVRDPNITDAELKAKLRPPSDVNWSWHTAATIEVLDPATNKPVTMVLDPSLGTGPMTTEEWKGKMKAQGETSVYQGKLGQKLELNTDMMSETQVKRALEVLKEMKVEVDPKLTPKEQVKTAYEGMKTDAARDKLIEGMFPERKTGPQDAMLTDHRKDNPRYLADKYIEGTDKTRPLDLDTITPKTREWYEKIFRDHLKGSGMAQLERYADQLKTSILDNYSETKNGGKSSLTTAQLEVLVSPDGKIAPAALEHLNAGKPASELGAVADRLLAPPVEAPAANTRKTEGAGIKGPVTYGRDGVARDKKTGEPVGQQTNRNGETLDEVRWRLEQEAKRKAATAGIKAPFETTTPTTAVPNTVVEPPKTPVAGVVEAPTTPLIPKIGLTDVEANVLVHMAKNKPELLRNMGMSAEQIEALKTPTVEVIQDIERTHNVQRLKDVTADYLKAHEAEVKAQKIEIKKGAALGGAMNAYSLFSSSKGLVQAINAPGDNTEAIVVNGTMVTVSVANLTADAMTIAGKANVFTKGMGHLAAPLMIATSAYALHTEYKKEAGMRDDLVIGENMTMIALAPLVFTPAAPVVAVVGAATFGLHVGDEIGAMGVDNVLPDNIGKQRQASRTIAAQYAKDAGEDLQGQLKNVPRIELQKRESGAVAIVDFLVPTALQYPNAKDALLRDYGYPKVKQNEFNDPAAIREKLDVMHAKAITELEAAKKDIAGDTQFNFGELDHLLEKRTRGQQLKNIDRQEIIKRLPILPALAFRDDKAAILDVKLARYDEIRQRIMQIERGQVEMGAREKVQVGTREITVTQEVYGGEEGGSYTSSEKKRIPVELSFGNDKRYNFQSRADMLDKMSKDPDLTQFVKEIKAIQVEGTDPKVIEGKINIAILEQMKRQDAKFLQVAKDFKSGKSQLSPDKFLIDNLEKMRSLGLPDAYSNMLVLTPVNVDAIMMPVGERQDGAILYAKIDARGRGVTLPLGVNYTVTEDIEKMRGTGKVSTQQYQQDGKVVDSQTEIIISSSPGTNNLFSFNALPPSNFIQPYDSPFGNSEEKLKAMAAKRQADAKAEENYEALKKSLTAAKIPFTENRNWNSGGTIVIKKTALKGITLPSSSSEPARNMKGAPIAVPDNNKNFGFGFGLDPKASNTMPNLLYPRATKPLFQDSPFLQGAPDTFPFSTTFKPEAPFEDLPDGGKRMAESTVLQIRAQAEKSGWKLEDEPVYSADEKGFHIVLRETYPGQFKGREIVLHATPNADGSMNVGQIESRAIPAPGQPPVAGVYMKPDEPLVITPERMDGLDAALAVVNEKARPMVTRQALFDTMKTLYKTDPGFAANENINEAANRMIMREQAANNQMRADIESMGKTLPNAADLARPSEAALNEISRLQNLLGKLDPKTDEYQIAALRIIEKEREALTKRHADFKEPYNEKRYRDTPITIGMMGVDSMQDTIRKQEPRLNPFGTAMRRKQTPFDLMQKKDNVILPPIDSAEYRAIDRQRILTITLPDQGIQDGFERKLLNKDVDQQKRLLKELYSMGMPISDITGNVGKYDGVVMVQIRKGDFEDFLRNNPTAKYDGNNVTFTMPSGKEVTIDRTEMGLDVGKGKAEESIKTLTPPKMTSALKFANPKVPDFINALVNSQMLVPKADSNPTLVNMLEYIGRDQQIRSVSNAQLVPDALSASASREVLVMTYAMPKATIYDVNNTLANRRSEQSLKVTTAYLDKQKIAYEIRTDEKTGTKRIVVDVESFKKTDAKMFEVYEKMSKMPDNAEVVRVMREADMQVMSNPDKPVYVITGTEAEIKKMQDELQKAGVEYHVAPVTELSRKRYGDRQMLVVNQDDLKPYMFKTEQELEAHREELLKSMAKPPRVTLPEGDQLGAVLRGEDPKMMLFKAKSKKPAAMKVTFDGKEMAVADAASQAVDAIAGSKERSDKAMLALAAMGRDKNLTPAEKAMVLETFRQLEASLKTSLDPAAKRRMSKAQAVLAAMADKDGKNKGVIDAKENKAKIGVQLNVDIERIKASEESAMAAYAMSTSEMDLSSALQSLAFASTPEGLQTLGLLQAQLDSVRRSAVSVEPQPLAVTTQHKPTMEMTADMQAALNQFTSGADKGSLDGSNVPHKVKGKQGDIQI